MLPSILVQSKTQQNSDKIRLKMEKPFIYMVVLLYLMDLLYLRGLTNPNVSSEYWQTDCLQICW